MDTPFEVNVKYHHDEGDLFLDLLFYQYIVCSLNYLTITGSHISFIIQQMSQFMHYGRHIHLTMVHCIIHYLKRTSQQGLFFPIGITLKVIAYSDVDWVKCLSIQQSGF